MKQERFASSLETIAAACLAIGALENLGITLTIWSGSDLLVAAGLVAMIALIAEFR